MINVWLTQKLQPRQQWVCILSGLIIACAYSPVWGQNPKPELPANDFGGVPPIPGTRREMAPGEAPELYQVEEGDTMFDVCSQLIDDGNYWPKLWSLNPDVKNPHFIYPGMRLAFYAGDADTPPYLQVVTDDEVVPVDKGDLSESDLVAEDVSSGGMEGKSVKDISNMSENDPIEVVGPTGIGADNDGLDGFIMAGTPYKKDDLEYMASAFFFEEEKESLGTVVSGPSGENLAGDGKRIYIRPADKLSLGTYSVLRPMGKIYNLKTSDFVAYRYEYAGSVHILRTTTQFLLEGEVFAGHKGVQPGDIIVPYLSTHRVMSGISATGAVSTADSVVIGFVDAGQHAGGLSDIVYLDKKNISVGGFYRIFSQYYLQDIKHIRDSELSQDSGSVGVVRILEINGPVAVGYISSGTGEVRLGDSLSVK